MKRAYNRSRPKVRKQVPVTFSSSPTSPDQPVLEPAVSTAPPLSQLGAMEVNEAMEVMEPEESPHGPTEEKRMDQEEVCQRRSLRELHVTCHRIDEDYQGLYEEFGYGTIQEQDHIEFLVELASYLQ